MKCQIDISPELDYEIKKYMIENRYKRKDIAIPQILELFFLNNGSKNNAQTKE